eukprot:4087861-Amphidinium_carterae.1
MLLQGEACARLRAIDLVQNMLLQNYPVCYRHLPRFRLRNSVERSPFVVEAPLQRTLRVTTMG